METLPGNPFPADIAETVGIPVSETRKTGSASRTITPMETDRPLRLFMPGAFAQISASIRAAFARIEPEVELAFHAFVPSGILAGEIRAGAAADLYVSANTRYMDELFVDGFVITPTILAGNRLAIIVRPDGPPIGGLESLLDPSLTVVVPQPQTDPCGQYVAAMFREAGIDRAMQARLANGTLMYSRGSGDLPAFLADGRATAGIFYASEAVALGDAVTVVPLPPDLDFHDRIAFSLGRVCTVEPHSATSTMYRWLLGTGGQELLIAHGFLGRDGLATPPPGSIP